MQQNNVCNYTSKCGTHKNILSDGYELLHNEYKIIIFFNKHMKRNEMENPFALVVNELRFDKTRV